MIDQKNRLKPITGRFTSLSRIVPKKPIIPKQLQKMAFGLKHLKYHKWHKYTKHLANLMNIH